MTPSLLSHSVTHNISRAMMMNMNRSMDEMNNQSAGNNQQQGGNMTGGNMTGAGNQQGGNMSGAGNQQQQGGGNMSGGNMSGAGNQSGGNQGGMGGGMQNMTPVPFSACFRPFIGANGSVVGAVGIGVMQPNSTVSADTPNV